MAKFEGVKQKADEAFLHVYNRFSIAFDHGEGVYLYDVEGNKYLDFGAGIAVCSLGYNHPTLTKALTNQVKKLMHTSNLFYHEEGANAAKLLKDATGLSRVFFTNSGAEAIEGAIKLAKKFAYAKGINEKHEIIAMKNSFHGRTTGALSVTGNDHYKQDFSPLLANIKFAEYNDLESVKALVNENTCAIIFETVQGESGIYPASEQFVKGIRELCDKHNILMILDEIQCGMGRTGKLFAYEHYAVSPDVIAVAKALGGGVPVGAFVCNDKAALIGPGDHGTTYGGNPLVCAAIRAVFTAYEEEHIVENAKVMGDYLWSAFEQLKGECPQIVAHRGIGLMQGLEFNEAPAPIVKKILEAGLIVIGAGHNTIRFVPPLIIEKEHIDEMITILKTALK